MMVEKVPLGKYVDEIRERLGSKKKLVYSVTNQRGFIPALETFGKQVFSEDTSNYKVVRQDDLAFNPSRINVGSVALCPDANGGAVSPMYTIVRCREGLLPEYLLYFLRSPSGLAEINHRTEGAVRFQLKFADLQRIPVYLPSVSEQKRIVRIIDEADELRRLRAHVDRRTSTLVPAIFHEMFGDPVTNPKGWNTSTLGEQLSFITSGSRGWADYYSPTGAKFIRVQNLTGHRLNLDDVAYVSPPNTAESLRTKVQPNDIMISITGVTGLVACVPENIGDAYVSQHVSLLRLNQDVDPIFITHFLSSPNGGQRQLSQQHYGQTKPGLNLSQIRALNIYLPPPPLQQHFATRVAKVRALEESQVASRCKLDDLFDSLLYRAFRGEL